MTTHEPRVQRRRAGVALCIRFSEVNHVGTFATSKNTTIAVLPRVIILVARVRQAPSVAPTYKGAHENGVLQMVH